MAKSRKKTLKPAAALALMRAAKLTPDQRSAIASTGGVAAANAMTVEEKRERAMKGVEARRAKGFARKRVKQS